MTAASSRTSATRRLAWRRLGATLIDWLWILAYLVLLAVVGLSLYLAGVRFPNEAWDVLIALLTVVPVTIAAGWREMGPNAATPGKRRLRLEVASSNRDRPVGFVPALIRNVGKIGVPWQLGHITALGMFETFAVHPPQAASPTLWIVTAATYLLVILHVLMLFVGSGRPFYDRIAGTFVTENLKVDLTDGS